MLQTPSKAKPFWVLVKIKQLLPGADKQVRSTRITKPDGSEAVASIWHMLPSELEVSQDNTPVDNSENLVQPDNQQLAGSKP